MKQLILLTLLIWLPNLNSKAQICGTPVPTNPVIYSSTSTARGESSSFVIDVFFHVVRNSNGTNAFPQPNTDNIVQELNEYYNPHSIEINNAGTDFINNSDFLTLDAVDGTEDDALFATQNQSDAINFYIVDNFVTIDLIGKAEGIISKNLVMRNEDVLSGVSAHELGHCLNLLHTHDTGEGIEAIDGSNCGIAGDLICDTPADPRLSTETVNESCIYTERDGYSPLTNNIMSYSRISCLTDFTEGQGTRMRTAILVEPILQNIGSVPDVSISEVNFVCPSQSTDISLSNLNGATAIWTSSPNILINYSNTFSANFQSVNEITTEPGWIKATLSNGIELTEEFWIGTPTPPTVFSHSHSMTSPIEVELGSTHSYYVQDNYSEEVGVLSYEYQIYGGTIESGSGPSRIISYNLEGVALLKVRVDNFCGDSNWKTYEINVTNTGGCLGCGDPIGLASVYPNPVSNTLNIEINNIKQNDMRSTRKTERMGSLMYKLYNSGLELILEGGVQSLTRIDVSSFEKGKYFLNLYDGNKVETHQLSID